MTAHPLFDLLEALLQAEPEPASSHTVKSPNHEEGFNDGMIESLDRTLHVIDSFPDLTLADLRQILAVVRAELAADDDDDDDDAEDATLAMLRAVFGPDVQIVRLEPAAR